MKILKALKKLLNSWKYQSNLQEFKLFHYKEEKQKSENRIYGKPIFYPPNGTGRDYYIILNNGGLTKDAREMRKTEETKFIESLRTDTRDVSICRDSSHKKVVLGELRCRKKEVSGITTLISCDLKIKKSFGSLWTRSKKNWQNDCLFQEREITIFLWSPSRTSIIGSKSTKTYKEWNR